MDIFLMSSVILILIIVIFSIIKRRNNQMNKSVKYAIFNNNNNNNKPKLMVIGCGFLGTEILRQLCEDADNKWDIHTFDIHIPSEENRFNKVTYHQGDLLNYEHLNKALHNVNVVIHTASIIPLLTATDELMNRVNVKGVATLLASCIKMKVKNFVYTSSATVLLEKNNDAQLNVKENAPYPPINKHVDTYTLTKRKAEQLIRAIPVDKLNYAILRPAGIFGAGDKVLLDENLRNPNNVYLGEGTSYIDLVHVSYVADAHIKACNKLYENAKLNGRIYNIGNGDPIEYRRFIGYGTTGDNENVSWWNHKHPKSVPFSIVYVLGHLNVLIYRLTGVALNNFLMPATLNFTQRSYSFDCTNSVRDLGYKLPRLEGLEKKVREERQRYELNK